MTTRICANPACAQPLMTRNQRKFCSHPCATAGARTRPLRTVACPCGATFTTTDPVQRYCSAACRLEHGAWKREAVFFQPRQVDKVWRR